MEWPYHFVKLTEIQSQDRRLTLDRYGFYGQLSALLPVVVLLIPRLLRQTFKNDHNSTGGSKTITASAKKWFVSRLTRRTLWWLGGEFNLFCRTLGRRDECIAGVAWTSWLLVLSFYQTSDDYFHVSRRFGIVGISQLPLLYLLASKRLTPVIPAFRTSHEEINRWHRALGYITYTIISLHAIFYLNKYYQNGDLPHIFGRFVPVLGISGWVAMTLLTTTTLEVVRRYSYRLFYGTHILGTFSLPVIIWFHVPHGRFFMAESLLILLADLIARRWSRIAILASLDAVPGTNLIKVVAEVPPARLESFKTHPALHAYFSLPTAWRKSGSLLRFFSSIRYSLVSNPFTVASIDKASDIKFVIRGMSGPLTSRLASQQLTGTKASLSIEGPYGATRFFPELEQFDSVLLVAGGVGATFIMPLYERIVSSSPSARVNVVWAVRNESEAAWIGELGHNRHSNRDIHLFVTGSEIGSRGVDTGSSRGFEDANGGWNEKSSTPAAGIQTYTYGRPDLQQFVDGLFESRCNSKVALLVCGPAKMARESREAIGVWVDKGEDVWFHNESFGW